MRIALVRQRYIPFGGAERYMSTVASQLALQGHEVHVFANRWDENISADGTTLHRVPMIRATSFLRALSFALRAKKAVAAGQFDVVFSFERTLRQDIYRAGDGCHREYLIQRRRYSSPAKRLAIRLNPLHLTMLSLEKRVFSPQNTRAIIANSHRGKEEIVRHYRFPADRIHVIHNGVDFEQFKFAPREQRGDGWVLLFVGTGFERKGLEFCIRALALLPPDARLRVAGKGDRARYERLARRLGVESRVEFLGATEDIQRVYASGDLLVLPAIYEPFANVCLEAMASGLPVVTSRINGASEIIIPGENGAVIEDAGDVDGLAAAIRPFLDMDLYLRATVAARKTAELLPFSENVNKTLEIIQSLNQQG